MNVEAADEDMEEELDERGRTVSVQSAGSVGNNNSMLIGELFPDTPMIRRTAQPPGGDRASPAPAPLSLGDNSRDTSKEGDKKEQEGDSK